MTKREQRLLMTCLAALALVVDLRLLVLPALVERRELTDTLQALTAEQTLRRSRIECLEYIDGAIAEKEQALAVASAPYYTYLSTEEMDRIVTELLLRHDFFPQQLRRDVPERHRLTFLLRGSAWVLVMTVSPSAPWPKTLRQKRSPRGDSSIFIRLPFPSRLRERTGWHFWMTLRRMILPFGWQHLNLVQRAMWRGHWFSPCTVPEEVRK